MLVKLCVSFTTNGYTILREKNHFRRSFKLTESHIHPTTFEKMNVGKAAQLLSDSVAHALRRYRGDKKFSYLFKDSETTERFTKLINDVFDVMNGRFIAQGINVNNWWKKKKKLDTFLDILDLTKECNRTRKPNDPKHLLRFSCQTQPCRHGVSQF